MFTYQTVENALARANKVPESGIGAFRGKIKHFRRLGMVPESPGKGKKISYERETVYGWAICLELAQFGIDPTVIRDMLWRWDSGKFLKALIQKTITSTKESYFVFNPPFGGEGMISPIIHSLDELKRPELSVLMTRMGLINLSHVLLEVEKALEEVAK